MTRGKTAGITVAVALLAVASIGVLAAWHAQEQPMTWERAKVINVMHRSEWLALSDDERTRYVALRIAQEPHCTTSAQTFAALVTAGYVNDVADTEDVDNALAVNRAMAGCFTP